MLPQKNIVTPDIRSAWKYVPTDELAGDAIGLHLIDDRFLIAYVLDVSGHGVLPQAAFSFGDALAGTDASRCVIAARFQRRRVGIRSKARSRGHGVEPPVPRR